MATYRNHHEAHLAHLNYPFAIEPGAEWSPDQELRMSTLLGLIGSDFLGDVPLLTALDVGCNSGYFMELLQDAGIEPVGCDIAQGMVIKARAKGLNAIHLAAEDLEPAFGVAQFSFVVLSEILEHLYDPLDVLRQAMRVSRYGVFGTVPHDRSQWGEPGHVLKHPHHCRRYTLSDLGELLQQVSSNSVIQSVEQKFYVWGVAK